MAGADTPDLAAAAEAGGADLVEIGFPFSDPLADGPVIRRAAEKALAARDADARLPRVPGRRRAHECKVPLVPMTYSSILEAYGWDRFAEDVRANGRLEEPDHRRPPLRRPPLICAAIQLVAPTSTDERVAPRRRGGPTAGSTSSR